MTMSITRLLNRPCTIVNHDKTGEEDKYGDPITEPIEIQTVCELQQRDRDEHDDAIADSSWLLVLPAGTDVRSTSSVKVDGVTYELVGEPWPARNPRTQAESQIECAVRRSEGGDEEPEEEEGS